MNRRQLDCNYFAMVVYRRLNGEFVAQEKNGAETIEGARDIVKSRLSELPDDSGTRAVSGWVTDHEGRCYGQADRKGWL